MIHPDPAHAMALTLAGDYLGFADVSAPTLDGVITGLMSLPVSDA